MALALERLFCICILNIAETRLSFEQSDPVLKIPWAAADHSLTFTISLAEQTQHQAHVGAESQKSKAKKLAEDQNMRRKIEQNLGQGPSQTQNQSQSRN